MQFSVTICVQRKKALIHKKTSAIYDDDDKDDDDNGTQIRVQGFVSHFA